MRNWLFCLVLVLGSGVVQAEAPRLRLLGSVGYSQGGDTLITATYSNGQPIELPAGTGWTWALGADFRVTDSIAIQASVGHQRNRVVGSNFDFDFQRQPVELLVYYSVSDQVRLGLGARKVQNAKLAGNDAAAGYAGTGSYDSSTGAILEGQYFFNTPSLVERKFVTGMYLRFVKESFTLAAENGGTGEAKRGDHVALGLVFYY